MPRCRDVQGSPALGKFYIVTDGGWQVSSPLVCTFVRVRLLFLLVAHGQLPACRLVLGFIYLHITSWSHVIKQNLTDTVVLGCNSASHIGPKCCWSSMLQLVPTRAERFCFQYGAPCIKTWALTLLLSDWLGIRLICQHIHRYIEHLRLRTKYTPLVLSYTADRKRYNPRL